MVIEFYKYQATGNDFIIIDDRENIFDVNDSSLIKSLCERRLGIGADGLILLRDHLKYDFEMLYFNSDGAKSSLCGNGARCIVKFAFTLGIISEKTSFFAIDGEHQANLIEEDVSIRFNDISKIEFDNDNMVIDSGSPHFIILNEKINDINIDYEARKIRNSKKYKSKGINVNFVAVDNAISMRTYERGVEAETLSCGTGAVATAVGLHYSKNIEDNIVQLNTKGGVLTVSFDEFNGCYKNIWLTGEVNLIYIGEFEC